MTICLLEQTMRSTLNDSQIDFIAHVMKKRHPKARVFWWWQGTFNAKEAMNVMVAQA